MTLSMKDSSVDCKECSAKKRRRLISALIRYSTKKRTLQRDATNTKRCQIVSFADGHLSSIITGQELSSIQSQLAVLSDVDGDRPIHIAVANEDLELVQKLSLLMIRKSISLDLTNYLGQTPLHLAVMLGNTELIKMLFNFGASPLVSDRKGNSLLHLAMKHCPIKEVFHTLFAHDEVKKIINSMDYEGYSPLHYAVFKNNLNAIQLLHSYGADVNKIDGKSGRTALIHAVLQQYTEIVQFLLECGSCPKRVDYSGRSAFEMALQMGNVRIAKLLQKWMPQNEVYAVKNEAKPASSANDGAKTNKRTRK